MKKHKTMIIISLIALLLIVVGISYAYFSAQITGSESSATITTETGTLNIVFDGGETITANNVYPQSAAIATKTFTVTGTNTTSLTMPYTLTLVMDSNGLSTGSLKYTLTSTNTSSNGKIVPSISNQTSISTGASSITLGSGYFTNGTGKVHTYILNIYYPETGSNQNADQGQTFTAHVAINSGNAYVPAPEGWYESTSGTLLYALKSANSISTTLTTPGQAISTSGETELASATDDYGTSYYYRGAVTNNYLQFANMCWRIVRITGDGSIKLVLYNSNSSSVSNPCDSSNNSDTAAFITGTSAFNTFTLASGDNAYIGFMYGTTGSSTYEATHTNTNSSTIKTNLETWYTSNLASYSSYLADTIWCNDKSMSTDATYLGYDKNATNYSAYQRLYDSATATPSLMCNSDLGSYTVSDTTNGNGILTDKVGLLTADEVAYAGGIYGTANNTYYLSTNTGTYTWWTMTPLKTVFIVSLMEEAYVMVVNSNSLWSGNHSNETHYIRPSISLKSTTAVTGTGTSVDPYVVQ